MDRDYKTGKSDSVGVFSGLEVEHTPAFGKQTLFLARNDLDFDQIEEGHTKKVFYESFLKDIEKDFPEANENLINHRLSAIAQLIALGKINIKIAWKANGIPHKKLGIFIDERGDSVAFNGSQN